MIGQGSPTPSPATARFVETCRRNSCRLLAAALALCAFALTEVCPDACRGEEAEIELRIAWGGGKAQQWQGSVSLDLGELVSPVPLGLEADEPASMVLEDGRLIVHQRSGRTYDGVDIVARAPLGAKLVVLLAPVEQPELARRFEFELARLVTQTTGSVLDTSGNRLSVRRTPGDRLRVALDRDRLVFSPGERFKIDVTPYLFTVQPEATVNLELRLLEARTEKEVWRDEHQLRADAGGALPSAGPLPVQLPEEEGVYDLQVRLVPWHLPAPFVRTRPVLERKLQLVCVSPRPPGDDAAPWTAQLEIDPAHPSRWDRWKQLPQFKLIPGFGQGPFGNDKIEQRTHEGREYMELAPDGWQAYPLPASGVGKPHIVEVEFPSDLPQTLGVSIVEPDATGKVAPIGLDSGVYVSDSAFEQRRGVGVHRLIFWPRTSSPLLLLVNREQGRPAVFGKIRLLAGPARLDAAPIAPRLPDERLLAALFEKPLFPENFSSDEVLDEASGRSLDDWSTFFRGGRRLTEYLRHVGYNAAVISVAGEGSALYPSRLLQPTPKYDTGVFFGSGQDPLRKDVLEMLLRLFDREGLVLIPAVQFSAPLPRLEALKREHPEGSPGIDLVDAWGTPYVQRSDASRGAPYYNPLDPRVQEAMLEVIDELVERYGHHRSFGGVALQLGSRTYAQFPGEAWGLDPRTVAGFARELGIAVPGENDLDSRVRYFQAEGRNLWLNWRAEKLAGLHAKMQQRLALRRRDARLYLVAADTLADGELAPQLRPALPAHNSLAEILLTVGLNPQLYRDKPGVVVLRPQLVAPLTSPAAEAGDVDLSWQSQLDRLFAARETGGLFQHQPLTGRLTSFEAKSPFGAENTHLWQMTVAPPEGASNRARFVGALAALDAQALFDGGWMLPLGQEAALRDLVEVYRRLPAQPFEDAASRSGTAADGPVVVRRLSRGGRTYLYAVNNSPWARTVQVQIEAPPDCAAERLGGRHPAPARGAGAVWLWSLQLEPYDLAGALFQSEAARVIDWREELLDGKRIADLLRHRLDGVRARAAALRTRSPLPVLRNADFELPPDQELVPGWVFAHDAGVSASADPRQHRRGSQSLRLSSTGGVAWVRSAPFEPPKTGRFSVWVWLKLADPKQQPPLRLAIEGRQGGRVYYKFAKVGDGEGAPRLTGNWADYLFQVDDLPMGRLSDLRVGFDLMGPGEVWIDDVQVFDMWFYDNERDELLKSIALADFQLSKGRLNDCRRFLESYWPRFLARHVPLAAAVSAPPAASISRLTDPPPRPQPPASSPPPENPPPSPTMFQRLRGMLPRRILPF